MMNIYRVNVTADIPYPWRQVYNLEATSEGVAVSRALRTYRKDVRKRDGRGKHIEAFAIDVRRVRPVACIEEDQ